MGGNKKRKMEYFSNKGAIGREMKRSFKTYRNKKVNTLPINAYLRHEIYSYLTFDDLRRMRCVCKMQPTTKNESMGRDAHVAIQTITAAKRFIRVFIPTVPFMNRNFPRAEVSTVIDDRKATRAFRGRMVCQHILILAPGKIGDREQARVDAVQEHVDHIRGVGGVCAKNVPFTGQVIAPKEEFDLLEERRRTSVVRLPDCVRDPDHGWRRSQFLTWDIGCMICASICTNFLHFSMVDTRVLLAREVVETMRFTSIMPLSESPTPLDLYESGLINLSALAAIMSIPSADRRNWTASRIMKVVLAGLEKGALPFDIFCASCLYGQHDCVPSLADVGKSNCYKRVNVYAVLKTFPCSQTARPGLAEALREICYPDELSFKE